jgi:hypothetical protein
MESIRQAVWGLVSAKAMHKIREKSLPWAVLFSNLESRWLEGQRVAGPQ